MAEFLDADKKFNSAKETVYLLKFLFPTNDPRQQAALFNEKFLRNVVDSNNEDQFIAIGDPEEIPETRSESSAPGEQPPEEISSSRSRGQDDAPAAPTESRSNKPALKFDLQLSRNINQDQEEHAPENRGGRVPGLGGLNLQQAVQQNNDRDDSEDQIEEPNEES